MTPFEPAPLFSFLLTGMLAALGFFVLARGLWPLRRRRALTGAGLLAAAGLLLWTWLGSPVRVPRAAVVVFSDDCHTDDLQAAVTDLGPDDQVYWVRATRAAGSGQPGASWMGVADARPRAGESPGDYRRRVEGAAAPVRLDDGEWLGQLLDADRTARAAFPRLAAGVYQHSLLVLHDRGATWGRLKAQGLAPAAALDRLRTPPTEVYARPAAAEDLPGRLELELARDVVPPIRVANLGGQQVRVSLRGAEPLRAAGARYRLDLWLDGGPDTPDDPHYGLTVSFSDPGPAAAPLRAVSLADAGPRGGASAETLLRPGLHRVLVRLTVHSDGGAGAPSVYSASRHFLVDPRGILLLHPGDLGGLARPTWARPPANPAKLLEQFLLARNQHGQRGRSELSADNVVPFAFGAGADALNAALKSCRAVILVEPTHAELVRLDRELALGQRLRDGLTLLLVGPPVRAEPWPAWLRWAARPAPGTAEPWEMNRDRRVYFFPENLRLLKFPARDRLTRELAPDDITGLRAQRDVIRAVSRALGVTDPVVRVEKETEVAPFLTFDGPLQPRRGRFLRDDVEVSAAVYPPVAPFLHPGSDDGPALRPEWETVAAFLPARLAPLEDESALKGASLDPLRGPALHPGASVVLFLDDLPQPTAIPEAAGNALRVAVASEVAWPVVPPHLECVARLARLGVTVYAVRIQLDAAYGKDLADRIPGAVSADAYLDPVRKDPALAPFLREITLELTPASVERVGAQLAAWIKEQPGELVRRRAGRVIDERGLPSRPGPRRHRLLVPAGPVSDLDGPHASVTDARFPQGHPAHDAPAIQAYPVREGTVLVLGYSPFAHDVWQPDAGAAGWEVDPSRKFPAADGWGVQRLLDLAELTTPSRTPSERRLVVRGARAADDGTALWLDCWANLSGQATWAEPGLHRLEGDRPVGPPLARGRLRAVDPVTQGVTFQLESTGTAPLHGWFALDLGAREGGIEAGPAIYADLHPPALGGRNVRETLSRLAGLTGGAVLTRETAGEALVCRRSAAWLAGLLLTGLAVALLSPLFRPWAVLRRRRRGPAAAAPERRAASLDVQGVLVEWGLNPGAPRSARRAGDPAGQKPYEAGDSLATARPASLLTFVTGGALLPPRRPVVRQRFVGRALEAVILLDATPGLFIPADEPSKADYVVLLTRLLTGVVWGTGGVVRVQSLQQPDRSWGPRGAGDDSEDLGRFVAELLRDGSRSGAALRAPAELGGGRILFVISDLLADHEASLPRVLDECAREDVSFRLVHVRGAHDGELVGMGVSAMTKRLLDRAEWTPEDVAAEQEAHAARVRALVEGAGGRFATVTTDLNVDDVFDLLARRDILT